jgi:hypothetical protein
MEIKLVEIATTDYPKAALNLRLEIQQKSLASEPAFRCFIFMFHFKESVRCKNYPSPRTTVRVVQKDVGCKAS